MWDSAQSHRKRRKRQCETIRADPHRSASLTKSMKGILGGKQPGFPVSHRPYVPVARLWSAKPTRLDRSSMRTNRIQRPGSRSIRLANDPGGFAESMREHSDLFPDNPEIR